MKIATQDITLGKKISDYISVGFATNSNSIQSHIVTFSDILEECKFDITSKAALRFKVLRDDYNFVLSLYYTYTFSILLFVVINKFISNYNLKIFSNVGFGRFEACSIKNIIINNNYYNSKLIK